MKISKCQGLFRITGWAPVSCLYLKPRSTGWRPVEHKARLLSGTISRRLLGNRAINKKVTRTACFLEGARRRRGQRRCVCVIILLTEGTCGTTDWSNRSIHRLWGKPEDAWHNRLHVTRQSNYTVQEALCVSYRHQLAGVLGHCYYNWYLPDFLGKTNVIWDYAQPKTPKSDLLFAPMQPVSDLSLTAWATQSDFFQMWPRPLVDPFHWQNPTRHGTHRPRPETKTCSTGATVMWTDSGLWSVRGESSHALLNISQHHTAVVNGEFAGSNNHY